MNFLLVSSHLFPNLAADAGQDHDCPGEAAQPELAAVSGLALVDALRRSCS